MPGFARESEDRRKQETVLTLRGTVNNERSQAEGLRVRHEDLRVRHEDIESNVVLARFRVCRRVYDGAYRLLVMEDEKEKQQ